MSRFFRVGIQFGGFGNDTLTGGANRDYLFGGFGHDNLFGGAGRDYLFGGFGNDRLSGGAGSDKLFGGLGHDVAVFDGGVADYDVQVGRAGGNRAPNTKITNLNDSSDVDRTYGVEELFFAADNYTAFLTGQNNAVLARDDSASVTAGDALFLDALTSNDFDFDGDALSIVALDTTELRGTATLNDDGTVSFFAGSAFDALAEGETAMTMLRYTVSDGKGSTDTASVAITVTGVNDAPVLMAADSTVAENTTMVLQATSTDSDGDSVAYTLSGLDAALFAIDATGKLSFVDAPDFETPGDSDGNNVYDVTITATDAGGLSDSQDVTVTVTDEDETPPARVWINEFHYDNAGSDVGEFVEIAGTAGTDLTGWSLELYNGSNGTAYNTIALSGALDDTAGGFGLDVTNLPPNGLQNGPPDGIALVNAIGEVVEFISYEGTLTAVNGTAAGQTSVDVGVAEDSSQVIGGSIQRTGVQDEFAWAVTSTNTSGAVNTDQTLGEVAPTVFINEFHYDNAGADQGEFIEVAGTPGTDLTGWSIVLYNGNGGAAYNTISLTGALSDDAGEGYFSIDVPGLQNGSPDGFALVNADGDVVEFLSYEGELTAVDGPAAGMTSTDVGVSEPGSTEIGTSLQRKADGTWAESAPETRDASNSAPVVDITVSLNEFHYDNADGDVGEFIEVAGTEGGDLSGWTIALYNGNGGTVYNTLALTGTLVGEDGTGYASVDAAGIQNGSPDGIALVDPDGNVVEFISYEGTLTATDGPANGMTSTDVIVSETGSTAIGDSLQKQADGTWAGPEANTRDAANDDDTPPPPPPPPGETVLISAVQGSGSASTLVGQTVTVSAVVTAITSNGFYLQEEDADADADANTSEGIFVFTGDTPNVEVSASYAVTGSVSEQFGEVTQLSASTIELVDPLAALPTATNLTFPFTTDLETVEGMQVSITTAGDTPLTVIENFQLGRFGEVVLSEGIQINPTNLFDSQTQLAEVQALLAQNAANRLIIDDGESGSNPLEIGYVANNTPGDNGNGILDAGDDFSQGGTLRIGAEVDGALSGIVTFSFGDFKILPIGTLNIDESTNGGARTPDAPEVGGDLKVVSFNALNYFTTLNERGATTEGDLARQTEKLVNALVELDGDVIGLQEIENNGFGEGSAIATLVDALNAELGSEVYAFVDPTDDGGLVGTDAITTGFIYKVEAVSVTGADVLIFDDGGQQRNRPAVAATFEDANGERITVAVNHFKSKGGTGTGDDADIGDGQGNFNGVRTNAAIQLTEWLETDPTGSGDPDYLIIGDLNAYLQEDPVQAIEAAGYDNLLEDFVGGEDAYSFVFDGQRGALDHALSTQSLTGQITGVAEWHINAEEPGLLGYSSEFSDAGFYSGSDPYAASDHDPLIVGLNLGGGDEFNFA